MTDSIPKGYVTEASTTSPAFRQAIKEGLEGMNPTVLHGLADQGYTFAIGRTAAEAVGGLPDNRGARLIQNERLRGFMENAFGVASGPLKFAAVGEHFRDPRTGGLRIDDAANVKATLTHEIGHNIDFANGNLSDDPMFRALMIHDLKSPGRDRVAPIIKSDVIENERHPINSATKELFADLVAERYGQQPHDLGKYGDALPGARRFVQHVMHNLENGLDARHGMDRLAAEVGYRGPLYQKGAAPTAAKADSDGVGPAVPAADGARNGFLKKWLDGGNAPEMSDNAPPPAAMLGEGGVKGWSAQRKARAELAAENAPVATGNRPRIDFTA